MVVGRGVLTHLRGFGSTDAQTSACLVLSSLLPALHDVFQLTLSFLPGHEVLVVQSTMRTMQAFKGFGVES